MKFFLFFYGGADRMDRDGNISFSPSLGSRARRGVDRGNGVNSTREEAYTRQL